MLPSPELRSALRENLDEVIPPGGSDTATTFSDTSLDMLLLKVGSVEEASYVGWRRKAMAVYRPGRLVTTRIGNESMTWANPKEMYDAFMKEAERWRALVPAGSAEGSGASRVLTATICDPLRADPYGWEPEARRCSDDASRLWPWQ